MRRMLAAMRPEERSFGALALALAFVALTFIGYDLSQGGGHSTSVVALTVVIIAQLLNLLSIVLTVRKRTGQSDSPERA